MHGLSEDGARPRWGSIGLSGRAASLRSSTAAGPRAMRTADRRHHHSHYYLPRASTTTATTTATSTAATATSATTTTTTANGGGRGEPGHHGRHFHVVRVLERQLLLLPCAMEGNHHRRCGLARRCD